MQPSCRDCRNKEAIEYRQKNGVEINAKRNLVAQERYASRVASNYNPYDNKSPKTCSRCKISTPRESFTVNLYRSDGLDSWCPDCKKDSLLQKNYGITLKEFDDMVILQGGACLICLQSFSTSLIPVVDHCHSTGIVRGALCHNCNRGIGLMGDDPQALTRAATYLRNYNK